jgi:hypothetical protein
VSAPNGARVKRLDRPEHGEDFYPQMSQMDADLVEHWTASRWPSGATSAFICDICGQG